MFHRKKPQAEPTARADMPIEPSSIFGADLLARLTPHLGEEGTERLAREFADDTIKRWMSQQTTETLTQDEKDRVFQAYKESGGGPDGFKIKELGSLYVLAAAEKIADQISSDTIARASLPTDLKPELAGRVVSMIKQLLSQEVNETLDAIGDQVLQGSRPREKPTSEPGWTPVNPQLSCNRPLGKLQRVFVFTEGDENSDATVMMGMLQDAAGAPVTEIRNQAKLDLITRSSVGREVNTTGSMPEGAWQAMEVMSPGITRAAHTTADQVAEIFLCIRGFEHPRTHEEGVLVLVYSE